MEWSEAAPKMGDMIRVKVKFYHHYGIYINDEQVVQFGMPDNSGINPKEIRVIVTDLETFMNGALPETAQLSKEEQKKRRPPKEVVRIALSRVGEDGYNILHNNCEHFANECMFGEARSSFVDGVRQSIRAKLK